MKTDLWRSVLANVGFNLNAAMERGHLGEFGFSEVYDAIEQGTIVRFLAERLGQDVDLSLLMDPRDRTQHDAFAEVMRLVAPAFQGRERRKLFLERSGVCLMMGLVLEALQQGYWSLSPSDEC